MKPRTKLEVLVDELSRKLSPITEKHAEWAKANCFSHIAYKCKDELWCTDCGRVWIDKNASGEICCPYCKRKLEVKLSRKQKDRESGYMTIAQTVSGFQVLRQVYVERFVRKGTNLDNCYFNEVCQCWYRDDGKLTVMARPMNMGSTGWIYHEERSIKQLYNGYGSIKYSFNGYLYPNPKYIPILKRNGLKGSTHGVSVDWMVRHLLQGDSFAETLIKTKQYSMLRFYAYRGYIRQKHTINICNRNHYIIKDASLYIDYLELLEYFHKDTHNPMFVCPKDLQKEHDILMEAKRQKELKERLKRNQEQRIRREQEMKVSIRSFMDRIKKYYPIEIKDKELVIKPLYNLTQFYEEGKRMHHCVWQCKYYDKPDTLILSARKNGERLETVEVNLKTYSIIQSRGVCNQNTPYHNRIIELVNRNMNLIRAI